MFFQLLLSMDRMMIYSLSLGASKATYLSPNELQKILHCFVAYNLNSHLSFIFGRYSLNNIQVEIYPLILFSNMS
jgi:hypothetical protein